MVITIAQSDHILVPESLAKRLRGKMFEISETKYVVDACALLAFLNDEPGAEMVDALLQKAKNAECTL